MTEGNTTHIYEYDSLDRLIRAWQKDANGNNFVAVENTYDELGRAKGSTYVVGGKTMSYDITYRTESNIVDSIFMPSSNFMSRINYEYDAFDRLTTKNISLSTLREYYEDYAYYTYTGTDNETYTTSLVSDITLRVISGGTTTSTVYSYTYDDLGNITSVWINGTLAESYEYDNLGQLIRQNNITKNYTILYTYDKAGNLKYKSEFDYTTAATSSMAIAGGKIITPYVYTDTSWGDLLTRFGSTVISYDSIGNPTNWRNSTTLTWTARELASQTLADGNTLTYTYNSDGIRTRKVYNDSANGTSYSHNYLLDGTKVIRESVITAIDGGTEYELYYVYDENGNVAGLHYDNKPYYFQKNLQGDIIRILDYTGNVVVEYTYDAWGNALSATGSMSSTLGQYNPFRYRGYYYDRETGFYYLQSRYYDPVVGRFLNADHPELIGANGGVQGYNLFAYCNNNPIQFSDSEGTCIHGDGYYWFQFAGHDLRVGDMCRVCKRVVDATFFKDPYLWTKIAQSNPSMSGKDISGMVKCTRAHENAALASRNGRTQAEKQEIYEQEMAAALCFVAGTIVKTEIGDEVIENIQVGDYVWARNPETGETALKRVVQTFRNETTELVIITAGNDVIEATPEHPFYVQNCNEIRGNSTGLGKGWVKAKDLRKGDILVLLNGATVTVDKVTTTKFAEAITVYNFEVEDFHTYFVGKDGWLVHNTCFDSNQQALNSLAKGYARTGISSSEASILWEFTVQLGYTSGPSFHPPQRDSYKNGALHMKVYGYHIDIY